MKADIGMEKKRNGSRRNTNSNVLGVQDVGDTVNEIYCVPTHFHLYGK